MSSSVSKEIVKKLSNKQTISGKVKEFMKNYPSIFTMQLNSTVRTTTNNNRLTLSRPTVNKKIAVSFQKEKSVKKTALFSSGEKLCKEQGSFVLMINKTKINNIGAEEIKELLGNLNSAKNKLSVIDKTTQQVFSKEEFLQREFVSEEEKSHEEQLSTIDSPANDSGFDSSNNSLYIKDKDNSLFTKVSLPLRKNDKFRNDKSFLNQLNNDDSISSIEAKEMLPVVCSTRLLDELSHSNFVNSFSDNKPTSKVINADLFLLEIKKEKSLLKFNNQSNYNFVKPIAFDVDVDDIEEDNSQNALMLLDRTVNQTLLSLSEQAKLNVKGIKDNKPKAFKSVLNKDQIRKLKGKGKKLKIDLKALKIPVCTKEDYTLLSQTRPATPEEKGKKKRKLRLKAKVFEPKKIQSFNSDEREKLNQEIRINWRREMVFSSYGEQREREIDNQDF